MNTQTPLTRHDAVGSDLFDSIAWALEWHVEQADKRDYHFAILHGNEDAPSKIEFWRSAQPLYHATPDFVWESAYEGETEQADFERSLEDAEEGIA